MINMPNRGLTEFPGISPNETQIRLENNQISFIPSNIGQFKLLTHLYLRNNKIVALPQQIGLLEKIQIFLLSNNQIKELPSEIGKLTSLSQLRIENNLLATLPKEIGNLTNLTHLFLDNNQLTSLPEEIKNLTKLVHLSLDGNQLQLPDNYSPSNPKETIAFILERQLEFEEKESLITQKAFYFINASKKTVEEKYMSMLHNFSFEKKVFFNQIQSIEDVNNETNVVFIIAPIDVHENDKIIFDIAAKCKKHLIRFYILIQKGFIEKDYDSVNLKKGEAFENISSQLLEKYPNECNTFSSYEEFNNLIFEALKQHKPNIRFSNLYLENIGHFSQLDIPLDKDLTCIIGENGTGKSTILRAIALAAIGYDHKNINDRTLKDFLKIQNFKDDKLIYQEGLIRLHYNIDGDEYFNELFFKPMDDGREVLVNQAVPSEIIYGKYNLKSLIVGFPQARGYDSLSDKFISGNKITQPHINDLLPMINNSDDFRLQSFAGWIANLYGEAIKNADKNGGPPKEMIIIVEVFEVISKITKKEIRFKTVKSFSPPEIWITTYDSPNGVPLDLISQGFKIVIGWIGYFLQRFINTFPLSDPKSAFRENAILLVDEIDTSIHPIWQTSFLDVLRDTFPNTQFIFTTHSPLMIAGLSREQVVEMKFENNEIVALKNQVDTWALTYRDILQKLFDTTDPTPKKTVEELTEKISISSSKEEIQILQDDIKRLEESEMFENDLAIYEKQLEKKEAELNDLILKFKKKLKE